MSKASEWVVRINGSSPPTEDPKDLTFRGLGATAAVTAWPVTIARLSFYTNKGYSFPTFTANEALALAAWILETFGEPSEPRP